jgi:flagellar hook-length control protein FliK
MMTPPVVPSFPFARRTVESEKASVGSTTQEHREEKDSPDFLPALVHAMGTATQPQRQEQHHPDVESGTAAKEAPVAHTENVDIKEAETESAHGHVTAQETARPTPALDVATVLQTAIAEVATTASGTVPTATPIMTASSQPTDATAIAGAMQGKIMASANPGSEMPSLEVKALAELMNRLGKSPLESAQPTAALREMPVVETDTRSTQSSQPVTGLAPVATAPQATAEIAKGEMPAPVTTNQNSLVERLGLQAGEVSAVEFSRANEPAKRIQPPVPQATMLGMGEKRFIYHIARNNVASIAAKLSEGESSSPTARTSTPGASQRVRLSSSTNATDDGQSLSLKGVPGPLKNAGTIPDHQREYAPEISVQNMLSAGEDQRPQSVKNALQQNQPVVQTEADGSTKIQPKSDTSDSGSKDLNSGKSMQNAPVLSAGHKKSDEVAPSKENVPDGNAVRHDSAVARDGGRDVATSPAATNQQESQLHSQNAGRVNGAAVPSVQTDVPVSKIQTPVRPLMESHETFRAVEEKLMTGLSSEAVQRLREGVSELRLRLSPESLGEMSLKVRLNDDKLTAQIQVTQPDVKSALEADLPRLREALAARGLDVRDIDISSSGDSPARESHGQQDARHRSTTRQQETGQADVRARNARQMGYNTIEITM